MQDEHESLPERFRPNLAAVIAVAAVSLLTGLGGSAALRLTYHEGIVAQGCREMLARGDWIIPTINQQPWIEKPPLAHWLGMLTSLVLGEVTEFSVRLPSALAAVSVCVAIAVLVARRSDARLGTLAGLVQATTYWTVLRGRLADADILLAALVAVTMLVVDQIRIQVAARSGSVRLKFLSTTFYVLLGATSLAKGIGFGAILIVASVVVILLWDRDLATLRCLINPAGIVMAGLITLAWPMLVLARLPEALQLWTLHVADRLADRPTHFASGAWWSYPVAVVGMVLPWTPIAMIGCARSIRRAIRDASALDRLLVAWAFVPLVLLSFATVKNAHYAIHALPPWAAWAAMSLRRMGERFHGSSLLPRRWPAVLRGAVPYFLGLAALYSLTFCYVLPRYDDRGREWDFYRRIGQLTDADQPLVFLLDDWDRLPYKTPFGPVPHDLAVRLFYLDLNPTAPRPTIRLNPESFRENPDARAIAPFNVIARTRDLPALRTLGRVEEVAQGPRERWDRAFNLYRVLPEALRDDQISPAGVEVEARTSVLD